MQKDIHFYTTYALAIKCGLPAPVAAQIAWADQYTDEMTETDLYGIQTQSAMLGNWADRQIQLSVLLPFHFVPGDDGDRPWMVTADSVRVRQLVSAAIVNKCPFQLGIALHALQDSFSHQNFSGWQEKANACWPWYYLSSGLPNVGHAELGPVPDIVSSVWTDPRTNERIDNKKRALQAAWSTYQSLLRYKYNTVVKQGDIPLELSAAFVEIFNTPSYDERKERMQELLTDEQRVRYSRIKSGYVDEFGDKFITAASQHLAAAVGTFFEANR